MESNVHLPSALENLIKYERFFSLGKLIIIPVKPERIVSIDSSNVIESIVDVPKISQMIIVDFLSRKNQTRLNN